MGSKFQTAEIDGVYRSTFDGKKQQAKKDDVLPLLLEGEWLFLKTDNAVTKRLHSVYVDALGVILTDQTPEEGMWFNIIGGLNGWNGLFEVKRAYIWEGAEGEELRVDFFPVAPRRPDFPVHVIRIIAE